MSMTRKITFVLFVSAFISACGGTEVAVNTSNGNGSNSQPAAVNSNPKDPLAVTTPTPEAASNNAPTLTATFKAYCAAMVKKDDAALRKVYSKDTIAMFEQGMKEEGYTSLAEYLASTDVVTNDLCEVTNENIDGDSAVATIKAKSYPNGIRVVFVKEGGEWKLTNRSPQVPPKK